MPEHPPTLGRSRFSLDAKRVATSSPDGTKSQGAGPNASPVMSSMENAGSCASNACHSLHRRVPCLSYGSLYDLRFRLSG